MTNLHEPTEASAGDQMRPYFGDGGSGFVGRPASGELRAKLHVRPSSRSSRVRCVVEHGGEIGPGPPLGPANSASGHCRELPLGGAWQSG